jgi:hypothetical protein
MAARGFRVVCRSIGVVSPFTEEACFFTFVTTTLAAPKTLSVAECVVTISRAVIGCNLRDNPRFVPIYLDSKEQSV